MKPRTVGRVAAVQGDPIEGKLKTSERRGRGSTRGGVVPRGGDCVTAGAARSGGAATACGQLADVVQEDRALEGVELRGVGRDLGEEGIGHEDGCLVAMAGVGVAQQGRDVDLRALARRSSEDRVGMALPFSILEM